MLEETSFGQPHGILADLGVSMLQFSDPQRGFSFQEEGPLGYAYGPESKRNC